MPVQPWHHSAQVAMPCLVSTPLCFKKPQSVERTHPGTWRRGCMQARSAQPIIARDTGLDDAAFLEKIVGDSAGRLPKQLSARAQKQIQQLRSNRGKPQNPHSVIKATNSTVLEHHGKSGKPAVLQTNSTCEQHIDGIEKLPTKAELRGTLGTVNRRVYEQVTQSRNRLSAKLSAANKHIRQLQKAADSHHQEIATVNQCTQTILNELKTLSKLADTAASSAQFGTERMHTVAKMASLLDRMQALQQIVQDQSRELDLLTQRRIPVVWFGIAQQVRLMGSFDNWTQGFGLSAQEFSGNTFTRFQATLTIVPGSYEVKFLVDGQWRTAPDWPTVETPHGTNNVLEVV